MAPTHMLSSELKSTQKGVRVMMRVVRKWMVLDPSSNARRKQYTLEMVMMDSKCDTIGCKIRQQLGYKFKDCLQEDEVYVITNCHVVANEGEYRGTSHKFKLAFDYESEVIRQDKSNFPQITYKFVHPTSVFDSGYDINYLVDIIGVLAGFINEKEFEKNGKKNQLMTIELDNEGFRFRVALFGNLVEDLKTFVSQTDATNVVVALLFSKVKTWQGNNSISTTFASKMLINPEIPEVVNLKKNSDLIETPTKALSQMPDNSKMSLFDDFIKFTPRSTIGVMKEFFRKGKATTATQDPAFVILATIYDFVDENKWYYTACAICRCRANSDSGMYYCATCDRHVKDVTPKFVLRLRVTDQSTNTIFVIFDRDAEKLLKLSCAKLIGQLDMEQNIVMPDEVRALKDQRLLFKITCDRGSGGKFDTSFIVKRVTAEAEIISKFLEYNPEVPSIQTSTDDQVVKKRSLDIDAQDLSEKFYKAKDSSDNVAESSEQVVDLCSDADVEQSQKRKFDSDKADEQAKIMKNIKIEKI